MTFESKSLAVLGSTGSIGRNTLAVCRHLGARMCVRGLAAGQQWQLLAEQARQFDCQWVYIADDGARAALAAAVPDHCRVLASELELYDAVAADELDMVLCAIVGTAGLRPVLSALAAGKDLALASKEILVMAGEQVMALAQSSGSRILPVDSEHNALFQCLQGERRQDVRRLILTASGGPFRAYTPEQLQHVSATDALAHPTWNMGVKVTIDSATMMNKGLELIEACRLFDIAPEDVEIVVHPQSIVHSLVEFVDGSVMAHLATPDMRLPIQHALCWPERCPGLSAKLDLAQIGQLQFEPPDPQRFPALRLARQAAGSGGTLPAVFNAANEVAVARFGAGSIKFTDIGMLVEAVMQQHHSLAAPTLDDVLAADQWARQAAEQWQRRSI